MPRKGTLRLGEALRLTDGLTFGVLAKVVPPGRVREVLEETGRGSKRNRDLPAHVMVYYVILLGLYRAEETREVLRLLLQGMQWVLGLGQRVVPAGRSAISQARKRLGELPLKRLYERMVRPVATAQTPGAHYRGWHLVALDGTTLEVADTEANEAGFGRPEAEGEAVAAYPRLRLVGLVETGTHVMFAATLGRYDQSEVTMSRELIPHLKPGMLCLADRAFPGYALWEEMLRSGAALVWRVQKGIVLECEERLADGSYRSRIYPKREGGKPRTGGIPVRVVDYRVEGIKTKEEQYRLVTSILDPEAAPAEELAGLYHERWEFETTLDEFKTHLRGARSVLRSQSPELVRQECWGVLLAHYALRGVMHEAALSAGRDPDEISFLHTVRVVRRSLPHFAVFPPSALGDTPPADSGGDPGGDPGAAARPVRETRRQTSTQPVQSPAP